MMDEARYNGLVAGLWKRILAAVDQVDPDILDAVATGDMVTLTSATGEKVVINTQRAVRQNLGGRQGHGNPLLARRRRPLDGRQGEGPRAPRLDLRVRGRAHRGAAPLLRACRGTPKAALRR